MRIIQLTPGTGSFYCGTCLRDNALVVALREMGHDATMLPLYLPPALDEATDDDRAPLFYGGINVYLQQQSGLFRNTPRWVDSLFDSPMMLRAAARRAGMTQASDLGELTVSTLRGENGRQSKELARLADWLATEGRPDVACLSNVLLIGMVRQIKARTGATVVCTLQGEDSFLDSLPEPHRHAAWDAIAERASDVDAFIAVSRYHADLMCRRARIPEDRVKVVYNGIRLDGYERDAPCESPDPPVIGFLSRMCPPKGLETLVEAYILLRGKGRVRDVRLRVAGAQTEGDKPFVRGLFDRLAAEGLGRAVEFLPNLDRAGKIAFLKSLSVLSVPATYGESFGLYVIEALAAGVPVVQPRHAVFPELLEATGGGMLCEPDDPGSLADRLEELLLDPERARALGEQGREAVWQSFSAGKMAENVLRVFNGAAQS